MSSDELSVRLFYTGERRRWAADWGWLPIWVYRHTRRGSEAGQGATGALQLGRQKFKTYTVRVVHSTCVFSSYPRWGLSRAISYTLDLPWVGAADGAICGGVPHFFGTEPLGCFAHGLVVAIRRQGLGWGLCHSFGNSLAVVMESHGASQSDTRSSGLLCDSPGSGD